MANKCSYCGGILELVNGKMKCPYCGSYENTNITSEQEVLLQTAAQQLRLGNFDLAEAQYEDITKKYPDIADGYWGLVLARYGIKYEQDFDGKYIPTCYATSYESLYSSAAFKKALSLADPDNMEYFSMQAKTIEDIRKKWVEKASKEKPYDIFISFKDRKPNAENSESQTLCKESDRTTDSFEAHELYNMLTSKGYKVFFSRVSLRDKVGEMYEPYIFNALNTAKVMILYSSEPEYINSTWVKNEWTRFLKKIKNKEKKENSLLVVYKGFSPSALPSALARCQGLDRASMQFSEDLFKYLKKMTGNLVSGHEGNEINIVERTKLNENTNRVISTTLEENLKIANKFLDLKEFKEADREFKKILAADNDSYKPISTLGLLCVKYKSPKFSDIFSCTNKITDEDYDKIQYVFENIEDGKSLIEEVHKVITKRLKNEDILDLKLANIMIKYEYSKRNDLLKSLLFYAIKNSLINEFNNNIEDYLSSFKKSEINLQIDVILNEIYSRNSVDSIDFFDSIIKYYGDDQNAYVNHNVTMGALCLEFLQNKLKRKDLKEKAKHYFEEALAYDEKNHVAYWGLLRLEIGVYMNSDIPLSNIKITNKENFINAKTSAAMVDEIALKEYLDIGNKQEENLKKRKKKIIFSIIGIVLVIALLVFLYIEATILKPKQNLAKAIECLDNFEYSEAFELLDEIDYDEDSDYYILAYIGSNLEKDNYNKALEKICNSGERAYISYNALDGYTTTISQSFDNYSEITNVATLDHYTFTGWHVASFNKVENTWNINFEAIYEVTKYNITYNLKDGENDPNNPSYITYYDSVTFNAPTKQDCVFLGWTVDDSDVVIYDLAIENVTKDITLNAKWKVLKYTLSFENENIEVEDYSEFPLEYTLYPDDPDNAVEVKFKTSNSSIANISGTGVVTTPKGANGSAQITVFIDSQTYAVCTIHVSVNHYTYELNEDNTYTLTGLRYAIDELYLPDTYNDLPVTKIKEEAFSNGMMKEVYISDSILEIGSRAFASCNLLFSVYMGKNVNSIASDAFIDSACYHKVADDFDSLTIGNFEILGLEYDACLLDYGNLNCNYGCTILGNGHHLYNCGTIKIQGNANYPIKVFDLAVVSYDSAELNKIDLKYADFYNSTVCAFDSDSHPCSVNIENCGFYGYFPNTYTHFYNIDEYTIKINNCHFEDYCEIVCGNALSDLCVFDIRATDFIRCVPIRFVNGYVTLTYCNFINHMDYFMTIEMGQDLTVYSSYFDGILDESTIRQKINLINSSEYIISFNKKILNKSFLEEPYDNDYNR